MRTHTHTEREKERERFLKRKLKGKRDEKQPYKENDVNRISTQKAVGMYI